MDDLPCVLRNKFYISDPNYSNKMLILELRTASTRLFSLSASAEAKLDSRERCDPSLRQ